MRQEELNQVAVQIFRKALAGAAARTLLERQPLASLTARPLERYSKIRVLAIGKSALPLAGAAETQLADFKLAEAMAVVPHGYPAMPLPHYAFHFPAQWDPKLGIHVT